VPIIPDWPCMTGRHQQSPFSPSLRIKLVSTSNRDSVHGLASVLFHSLALCRGITYLTNSTTWLMLVVSNVVLSRFFLVVRLTLRFWTLYFCNQRTIKFYVHVCMYVCMLYIANITISSVFKHVKLCSAVHSFPLQAQISQMFVDVTAVEQL